MKPSFSFILVSPLYAGNVGSSARALHNMGFDDLRLVVPRCSPKDLDAVKMAMGGQSILKKARIFETISQAVADCHFVVGTSCERDDRDRKQISSRDLVTHLKKEQPGCQIGILFGPEEIGLSNEAVAYCDRMISIPANQKNPSLNLSQALLLVAYELSALHRWKIKKQERPPATKKSFEGMIGHLEEVLRTIGYLDRQNPFRNLVILRNLFRKVRPNEQEICQLRAIYRKVMYMARKG
ncbi:MAG: RNA methyltransferase [Deltaproteobacteria bacterium]|nr:RNA methyltransferase [Deltaproteobacteria bacterium]